MRKSSLKPRSYKNELKTISQSPTLPRQVLFLLLFISVNYHSKEQKSRFCFPVVNLHDTDIENFKEFSWNPEQEQAFLGVNIQCGDQTLHTKVWYTVLTPTVIHRTWKLLGLNTLPVWIFLIIRENRIETWIWIGLMDKKRNI